MGAGLKPEEDTRIESDESYHMYLAAFGRSRNSYQREIFGYMNALSDLGYVINVTYPHALGGEIILGNAPTPGENSFSTVFGSDARLWCILDSRRMQHGDHPIAVRAKVLNESQVKSIVMPMIGARFGKLGVEAVVYTTPFDDSTQFGQKRA